MFSTKLSQKIIADRHLFFSFGHLDKWENISYICRPRFMRLLKDLFQDFCESRLQKPALCVRNGFCVRAQSYYSFIMGYRGFRRVLELKGSAILTGFFTTFLLLSQ